MHDDLKSSGRILTILFILWLIACPQRTVWPAEKSVTPDSLVNELRPPVEFTGEESKEPFLDAISKNKEPAVEVPVAKPVEKEPQPALPPLTIQGVIWGSSVPCVIINNQVVKQGELIGDVKVTKIDKQGIKLLYKGWDYSLSSPAALVSLKNSEGGKK